MLGPLLLLIRMSNIFIVACFTGQLTTNVTRVALILIRVINVLYDCSELTMGQFLIF